MAGEIVYADLNIPSEPPISRPLDPSQQLSTARRSRWLVIILCFGNVILLAAVITLALQLKAEKTKPGSEAGRSIGPCSTNCSAALENFRSHLRNGLCSQNQSSSSVNSTCKFCPEHWRLHRDKCYWPSADIKSWHESQDYCSARHSHLVVIQDKEEKEYLKQITQDIHTYWAGLFMSFPEKKWVWMTGSRLDKNLFKEPNHSEEEYCGAIKNSKITSDTCNAEFRWVCQKAPLLI
ncbi:killer cell lectin-like receptor subfamily B member 1B allele A isoform X4 [Elgaria multicarinata webbii]|uniref:killer cell lectin-like receptor subfamily B member 1B allele A isoform X4 n=1 Tax=Elgaria multicarinata webbii TaxID=159646 RepID=UPI002FCD2E35